MKLLSSLLLAGLLYTSSHAFFSEHTDYQKDIGILSSLDIEASYLKDEYFLQIKSSESKAYKKHLLRAINEQYDNIVLLQDVLKNENVPTEIMYLAVIESGLRNTARSGRGASGIWQLVPKTARSLGLRVDKKIDERNDPVASTRAAAKYLSKLKAQFGKWYLAVLAYNCGDGKLRQAIAKAGSDDLNVLIDPKAKYLPPETRNFIRKILITAQIANDLNHIISTDIKLFNNPKDANLANININTFSLKNKVSGQNRDYKVQKGDTLASISKKFSVPLRELMRANDKKSTSLAIGEKIVIPR